MLKTLLLTVLLAVAVRESSTRCTCLLETLKEEFNKFNPNLTIEWNTDTVKLFNLQATSLQGNFQNVHINQDIIVTVSIRLDIHLKTPNNLITVDGFRNQTISVEILDNCKYDFDKITVTGKSELTVKTSAIQIPLTTNQQLLSIIETWCEEKVVMKRLINQGHQERRLFFWPKNGKLKD